MKDVRFHNPRLARVGVEALSLAELRERAGAQLGAPERVDFHLLLLVQAGRASHMVDFVEHSLRRGTVLFVRPGQVHQWRMTPGLQGQLVLISGEALVPSIARVQVDMKLLALDDWPAASRPGAALFAQALADVARLRADALAFAGDEVESAIIRHELLALLLRLARERASAASPGATTPDQAIHRLFARELEAHFHERLSVLDYARRIGYSESTLSRACVAAVGHTAKEALDRRVVLEAKRLLVHSDEPVAQIGHRLGFSEPTNFVKFFRRLAGTTPQAFRRA
jgi:AraC-like DNA-binding protein